jgi:hypothetical protein
MDSLRTHRLSSTTNAHLFSDTYLPGCEWYTPIREATPNRYLRGKQSARTFCVWRGEMEVANAPSHWRQFE